MAYVVCCVAAIPSDRRGAHTERAAMAADVFGDHGATRVLACRGAEVPPGEVTPFPRAVQARDGETVIPGGQEWPDTAAHDAGFPAAIRDARLRDMTEMPFDGRRMTFAGFDVLVDR